MGSDLKSAFKQAGALPTEESDAGVRKKNQAFLEAIEGLQSQLGISSETHFLEFEGRIVSGVWSFTDHAILHVVSGENDGVKLTAMRTADLFAVDIEPDRLALLGSGSGSLTITFRMSGGISHSITSSGLADLKSVVDLLRRWLPLKATVKEESEPEKGAQ